MGYELHIARKRHSSNDTGPTIAGAEWRRVIADDPDLALDNETRCTMTDGEMVFASWNGQPGMLAYYRGEIAAKNPDESLIRKMVEIAGRLNAQVQDDDGEIYGPDGSAEQPDAPPQSAPAPGLLSRLKNWFRARRTSGELHRAAPRFKVGSRVRDVWGSRGAITRVDPCAERGLGHVVVRFDDGREQCIAYVASGLEIDESYPSQ